jgi:hypothetical protein
MKDQDRRERPCRAADRRCFQVCDGLAAILFHFPYVRWLKFLHPHARPGETPLPVRVRVLGLPLKTEWTTVQFEEDRAWKVVAPLLGIPARKTRVFTPDSGETGRTRVDFSIECHAKPMPMALADALMFRPWFKAQYKRGMRNLRAQLEATIEVNAS